VSRSRLIPSGRHPTRLLALLALGTLLAVPAAAEEARSVRTARDGSDIILAFSVTDLFDTAAEEELESGLPTRVALRISLRRDGEDDPARASIRTCEVTYDLWDEVFHIHVEDERRSRWLDATSRRDAMRLCTVVRDARLDVSGLEAGGYQVEVVAELNPVSPEMLEGLRAWLRVPASSGSWGGEGESFFGSFVAVFINRRIGEADRTVRFHSATFDL
jgi:hypothetical protein